jgi:hypothetical protein
MFLQIGVIFVLISQIIAGPLTGFPVNPDLFDGDMKLSAGQESAVRGRTGLLELIRRWQTTLDGFVTIPYRFPPEYSKI